MSLFNILAVGRRRKLFSSATLSSLYSNTAFDLGIQKRSATMAVPSEADCIVIGGGSIGCSTFYHLCKYGMKNTVLLEKHSLTSGTTWHTTGFHWNLKPNDVEIDLLCYTRILMTKILPSELDQENTGWTNTGSLFIATNKERMHEFLRLITVGKAFGVEAFALTPKEIKEFFPVINVDDVYGGYHSPMDGVMDPSVWCLSLTNAGMKYGGKVIEHCPVTGIATADDSYGLRKVTGVDTVYGHIKTPLVVNCAGVWAPKIAQMGGVRAPTHAYHHHYALTDNIEGLCNMPNIFDMDGAFYIGTKAGAVRIGGFEKNPKIWAECAEFPCDFDFGLHEKSMDGFEDIVKLCQNRMPTLKTVDLNKKVDCLLSLTPDGRPLCGFAPDVKGYFYGHGFESGMMVGGGAGREMAKWIIRGRPDMHMYAWDIRRFNPNVTGNQQWIRERCHERYMRIYNISFLQDDPMAARSLFKSPFYEELLNEGCYYQERHSWERPAFFNPDKIPAPPPKYDFNGANGHQKNLGHLYEQLLNLEYTFDYPKNFDIIKNEALACRNNVAGFDLSYFGKFYLTGPDSQKAADWIFSNDIRKPHGSTVYNCMLNKDGRVEADLTVSIIAPGQGSVCDPDFDGSGFYITAGGGTAYQEWMHIQESIYEQKFNVKLENCTEDLGIFSIQGPNSRALLQELIPDMDFSDAAFPFSTNKVISVVGHRCRILRLSFVGELGYELHIPKPSCLPLYKEIHAVGEKFAFRNSGFRAMGCLACEKGYRFWSADLRLSDTPVEAGLAYTCKLKTDIDFQGRKAIEKQKAEGIKKRRVACFVKGKEETMLHGLEVLYRDNEIVGHIRTAEYGFMLERSIGYAYISRPDGEILSSDWIKSGSYEIECLGKRYPAEVTKKPPFDPENKRIRGIYE